MTSKAMWIRRFVGSIAPLALVTYALPAVAQEAGNRDLSLANQPPTSGLSAFLEKNDKNQDGEVTVDEIPRDKLGTFEQLLKVMDRDGSGTISRTEWTSLDRKLQGQGADAPPATKDRLLPEQIVKQLDKNNDGKIELAELPQSMHARFAKMIEAADANGDGAIDLAELRTERAASQLPSAVRPNFPSPRSKVVPVAVVPSTLLEALDADQDGSLSAQEIVAAPAALIKLDRDDDGRISPREMGLDGPDATPAYEPAPPAFAPAAETAASTIKIAVEHLMQKDHDGDGMLRKQDLPPVLASRFEDIDKNADGLIDEAELQEPLRGLSSRRVNIRGQQPTNVPPYEASIPLQKPNPAPPK